MIFCSFEGLCWWLGMLHSCAFYSGLHNFQELAANRACSLWVISLKFLRQCIKHFLAHFAGMKSCGWTCAEFIHYQQVIAALIWICLIKLLVPVFSMGHFARGLILAITLWVIPTRWYNWVNILSSLLAVFTKHLIVPMIDDWIHPKPEVIDLTLVHLHVVLGHYRRIV